MSESELKPIWWLPTLGFFLFLAIEISMFAGQSQSDRMFEDPGVGRHLRTAEFIIETGQIPKTDLLSFTHGGEPWFDFEWAFETTMGELYRVGGLALICAFCYAVFGATVMGIYRTLLQSGLSMAVVLLYTGMAFLTLRLHFAVRPVLFTYLFMALVVEVWYRQPKPRLRDWIFLPIVFVAWGNIHAGWLAALVFLGGALVGRGLDRFMDEAEEPAPPILPWVGLTLVCGLATLINPWGWPENWQMVRMATVYKSFAMWDEYLPPNFNTMTMSAITMLFLLGTISLARVLARAPRWKLEMFVPFLFWLYEGLRAQRHVLILMEVASVPVARDLAALAMVQAPAFMRRWPPLLAEIREDILERLRQFQVKQRLAGGDAILALIAAVIIAFLFMRAPLGQHITVGKGASPRLVAFLHEHPDRFHRPLTTTWNGGPLLWNARPDFRVAFDDRGDFFGDATVFKFVDMFYGTPGWKKTLAEGNYDSMILDPYVQLNQVIHFLPEWKEVYRDDHSVVYWKDSPAN